jgi:Zn-dependent protease with chaperone function
MRELASAPTTSTPGAANRISFFEEQARRRQHAKAWAFVAMGVAWLLGWVLGFLVLMGVFFYTLMLSSFLPRAWEARVMKLAPNSDAVFVPLVIGGLFFAIALWGAVRMIFGRDTSAAFLGRLNARPPNFADPEEKQLVNVAEEMAIAATAPVPRVNLFDGDAINAAVLGADAQHVTLLISRRMLDVLDRDETQGVIGHLTASAVNGDLQLTAEMLRVFHVLGLAVTILDLPFSSRARATFWELTRFVFRSRHAPADVTSESVAARLTESLQPEGLNALNQFMQRAVEPENDSSVRKVVGAVLLMPLLPLIMIRIGAAILYGLLSLFVLGPLVALLLRSRRRLADATAVQLTRHPDGLACALVHLVQEAHTVANAGWAEMLFIVGPEAAGARRMDQLTQRMQAIREAGGEWKTRAKAGLAVTNELAVERETETEARRHNFIFGFHPSLNSRIAQLKRMGATKVQWQVTKDYSGWIFAAVLIFVFGMVALLAIGSSRH